MPKHEMSFTLELEFCISDAEQQLIGPIFSNDYFLMRQIFQYFRVCVCRTEQLIDVFALASFFT